MFFIKKSFALEKGLESETDAYYEFILFPIHQNCNYTELHYKEKRKYEDTIDDQISLEGFSFIRLFSRLSGPRDDPAELVDIRVTHLCEFL